jgi:alpha-mannosidase
MAGAKGNVFQLFEDKPLDFDAWDINDFYKQKSWELDNLVSIEPIEQGSLRAGLRLEWLYNGRTRIIQKLYLYANNPRIDFVTQVDWQERQTLLKVAFPVDVHSPKATAEVQFGNIERPTHRNTSWDAAKFETCAHKWFDLSEGDYGVAILNDCKYGYDVLGNVMRQTLLKGAIYPDPQADLGLHEFTYSLLPHSGDWFDGMVHRAAYELNHPLLVFSGGNPNQNPKLPTRWSLVEVESTSDSVIVETVKKAEDNDDLIIRVYEAGNRRGKFSLKFAYAINKAVEVNLLEHDLADSAVEVDNNTLTSYIRPYQIKTFRVSLNV